MTGRIWQWLQRMWHRLAVRVSLVASLGLVFVLVSRLAGGLLPEGLATAMGADALDRLLDMLATSMLTVTTFSLAVMVTVYMAASQQFTPRTHRELLKDTTTQTALATFIGAFIYALAAIVMSSHGAFDDADQGALYISTLLVLALVVIEMLRWMVHLQTVGSLIDVAARIERDALDALALRQGPLWSRLAPPGAVPDGWQVRAEAPGYVQEISPEDLMSLADEAGLRIHLPVAPGHFVDRGEALAVVEGATGPEHDAAIRAAFHMGVLRTTEQDPRFGLVLLSEVGSKALSPGINDPGTAIDALGRIARILATWAPAEGMPAARVTMARLSADDMIEDAFEAIARDGASLAEVQIFLRKRLAHLSQHPDPALARAARAAADRALDRARAGIAHPHDLDRVTAAVRG